MPILRLRRPRPPASGNNLSLDQKYGTPLKFPRAAQIIVKSPSYCLCRRARAMPSGSVCNRRMSKSGTDRGLRANHPDGRFASAPRPKCAAAAREVGCGAANSEMGRSTVCSVRCEPSAVTAIARVVRAGHNAAVDSALGPRARLHASQSYSVLTSVVQGKKLDASYTINKKLFRPPTCTRTPCDT